MMRKIVQIKGTHGSGKSTIVRQLIELSNNVIEMDVPNIGGTKPHLTVMPDLKWVALAGYPHNKGGGVDRLHLGMADILSILNYAAAIFPSYWIVFEGAMIGTTQTAYNFMMLNWPDEALVVVLTTDVKTCYNRVLERRKTLVAGAIPVLVDDRNVKSKRDIVVKSIKRCDPNHIQTFDTASLPIEDMVYEFLSAIGWSVTNE